MHQQEDIILLRERRARTCRAVVRLAGIAMGAGGGGDVDDAALGSLAPFIKLFLGGFAHDRRSRLDEPEGCGAVDCQHGVPLLRCDFVDHAVPGKPCTA